MSSESEIPIATPAPPTDDTAAPEKVLPGTAVRAVLAENPKTLPSDGVALVRERYGLEITAGSFSTHKSHWAAEQAARAEEEARKQKAAKALLKKNKPRKKPSGWAKKGQPDLPRVMALWAALKGRDMAEVSRWLAELGALADIVGGWEQLELTLGAIRELRG